MTHTPFLFCRYSLEIDDEYLDAYEHELTLTELRGKMCAHRKSAPTNDDLDTRLIMPRSRWVGPQLVLSWYVDVYVTSRSRFTYDDQNDRLNLDHHQVAEDRVTKFIALPLLGVMAIDDSSGERHIGGLAAAQRFKSIFRSIPGGRARIDFSGTNADVEQALRTWGLNRVDFSIRPFNPTPRSPGEKLDKLLQADRVASARVTAKAHEGGTMRYSEDGLLREAWGLVSEGYGQIGVKGTTPQGLDAAFRKPQFSEERNKNIATQEKPRQLRVFIPDQPEEGAQEEEVVKALLEFYDRPGPATEVH